MQNRSYRKFDESHAIDTQTLLDLIDTARLCPASVNIQPLKFVYCNDKARNDLIFPQLAWARLLKDFSGPAEGERPTAYIIVCTDKAIGPNIERFTMDVGIVSQTILLAAVEKGLGGCMIGNFNKQTLAEAAGLPENLDPSLVLALGKPNEEIVLKELPKGGNTNYYREGGVHYVPKRTLEEIAVKL